MTEGAVSEGPSPSAAAVLLDESQIVAWGRAIGATMERPAVLALQGPLGAGKSTLARAIGRGSGLEGPIPSPTFNLLFSYETPGLGTFVHVEE